MKRLILFGFILSFAIGITQISWIEKQKASKIQAPSKGIEHLEIPALLPNEEIVKHTGFTLSYNERNEQANWVAYELTKEETVPVVKRSNKFVPDPDVPTGSATDEDYKNSGYDRGHLAPAADMEWSPKAMAECFYYSNMSPQVPAFNRGIWKKLEERVRAWAIENQDIYVVTGPVLTKGLSTIGPHKVSVPKYYYKVILDYRAPGIKAIGFLMPNAKSMKPLESYAVSVDSVEKITGIDFFPKLPDAEEKALESTCKPQEWSW
ncbi:MAG: DNA/RNA non-specific endonuclease [Bacteroidota bacterium]|nr:DNA/RNA non-specific endonuclease [Bacteroidota bacterium]